MEIYNTNIGWQFVERENKMKLRKSGIFTKIIIILILIILFNAIMPKELLAWDIGGILMKPLTSLVLVVLVSVDATMGIFLTATDMLIEGIGTVISEICDGTSTLADTILVGPDTIFSGNVGILDANIFNVTVSNNGIIQNSNVLGSIKEGIAETYVIVRNICAILMLAGLIFTGIRILVSANLPNKKAEWMRYLQDWLIGIVLLIFSHIIMIIIFYVSDTIVAGLRASMFGNGSNWNWELVKQCFASFDSAEQIVCLVMLGYMIYLTVVFAIAYFKRLMWVCVLIVIAPIVAIMYAFGNQTKQIYSKWLREYIMTVLVQPFHMIIYYTLFSVPLNMTGSNGFTLSGSNMFTLIYALGAISFIRPAEKYVRELFGMDKGLANMASFDSGKQTMDAVVDSVKDAFTKIAMVAAVAATGGAAAPVVAGAAGTGIAAGASGAAAGTAELGAGIATEGGTIEGTNLLGTPESSLIDAGLSGPIQEEPEWSYSPSSAASGIEDNPDLTPSQIAEKERLEEQIADGQIEESELTNDQRRLLGRDLDNEDNNDNIDSTEQAEESLEREKINAENVMITAGNVSMQGKTDDSESSKDDDRETAKVEGEKDNNKKVEDDFDIDQKEEKSKILNPVNPLSSFMKVATGQKGLFETIGDISPRLMDNKIGNKLEQFEEIGGMQSLHKGFNQIRDTFYATKPPEDWKRSDERMGVAQKEKQEQTKYNICNQYREQFAQKYFLEYKKQYKDNKNYNEARLMAMAKDKADSKLKSLTDTYVPLGVTDANVMLELDQDRKTYGLTVEEAIQQRTAFTKFNNNKDNVVKVNIENKADVHTVTDVIPNAKDYYNSGYNNTKDMAIVKAIEEKLKVSPDYAIQIDKALRKKGGKLNYKGDNNDIKDIVKQINEQYDK